MVRLVRGVNDLETLHPKVAQRWHPTLNAPLTPSDVSAGTNRKVWWLCTEGHSYQSSVYVQTTSGCSICAGKEVLEGFNDFASVCPDLLDEWDYERNQKSPKEIYAGSTTLVNWVCKTDSRHKWEARVFSRRNGRGCPVCNNRLVIEGVNDLATTHPDIAVEWDEERNSPLRVNEIVAGSNKVVWWICPKGHHYQMKPNFRTGQRNGQCAVCENRQIEVGVNDLLTTRPDLVAEIDREFHPDLVPTTLTSGSGKRLHWKCSEGHKWEATVINRGRPEGITKSGRKTKGTGCPKCNKEGPGLRATPEYNFKVTHPELAKEWDYEKNDLNPEAVTKGRTEKVYWVCELGHRWRAAIANRAYLGQGCRVCANQEVQAGFNDLQTRFPDIAREWHPSKNTKKPSEVGFGTATAYWWMCENGHSFKSAVVNRTANGSGCRTCTNMGFDPTAPGFLYLLRDELRGLQQFGITNVPERRLATHRKNGWEVLDVVGPADGYWIDETELAIKHFLRDRGVLLARDYPDKFDGYSESWKAESISYPTLAQLLSDLRNYEW